MTSVTHLDIFSGVGSGSFFSPSSVKWYSLLEKTSSHTLSFPPDYLQNEALLRATLENHGRSPLAEKPGALDWPRRPVRVRTLKTTPSVQRGADCGHPCATVPCSSRSLHASNVLAWCGIGYTFTRRSRCPSDFSRHFPREGRPRILKSILGLVVWLDSGYISRVTRSTTASRTKRM